MQKAFICGILFLLSALSASSLFFDYMFKTSFALRTGGNVTQEYAQNQVQSIVAQKVIMKLKIALNFALAMAVLTLVFWLTAKKTAKKKPLEPKPAKTPMTRSEKILAVWFTLEVGPTVLLLGLLFLGLVLSTLAAAVLIDSKDYENKYATCALSDTVQTCLQQNQDIANLENLLFSNFIMVMVFASWMGLKYFSPLLLE